MVVVLCSIFFSAIKKILHFLFPTLFIFAKKYKKSILFSKNISNGIKLKPILWFTPTQSNVHTQKPQFCLHQPHSALKHIIIREEYSKKTSFQPNSRISFTVSVELKPISLSTPIRVYFFVFTYYKIKFLSITKLVVIAPHTLTQPHAYVFIVRS